MTQLPAAVTIREVGPRDGLQLEPPLTTGQKLRLIEALARTGVDLDRCLEAARLAQELVGHRLDSNLVRAGGRPRPACRAS